MPDDLLWMHSESRLIHPYRVSENALAGTGFRLSEDEEFVASKPWRHVFSEDERPADLKPEFDFDLDIEELFDDVAIESLDLDIAVIVRDPGVLEYRCIQKWPLTDIPGRYSVPGNILSVVSGAKGIDFALVVSPNKSLKRKFRFAHLPGQVVAGRVYEVRWPTMSGSTFPIDFVDPDKFQNMHPPRHRNTTWTIEWRDESEGYDRPLGEVLRILISHDLRDKFLRLSESDPVGRIIWAEIAVEAYVEICLKVYTGQPALPTNQDGLLWKLTRRMYETSKLNFNDLVRMASNQSEGHSFFRSQIQEAMELNKIILNTKLVRR
jgi:hypothetical protein